jgi:hypothetical protein
MGLMGRMGLMGLMGIMGGMGLLLFFFVEDGLVGLLFL